jgi:hypothetical protein
MRSWSSYLKDWRLSKKTMSKSRERISFSSLTSSEEPRTRENLKRSQMRSLVKPPKRRISKLIEF